MTNNFKGFLFSAGLLVAMGIGFHGGYLKGNQHGKIDGEFEAQKTCFYYMVKLAKTLKEQNHED